MQAGPAVQAVQALAVAEVAEVAEVADVAGAGQFQVAVTFRVSTCMPSGTRQASRHTV